MKAVKVLALGMLALAVTLGAVRWCSALPPLEGRPPSTTWVDTAQTRLGRSIGPMAAAHPGLSGIYPLRESRNAFAARVLLARAAERSLDVQYYIWQADLSGTLLLQALRDAADRGVRVRLLLDDNGTPGLDRTLSALNAHANIEVRLFNPFVIRSPRFLGYLTDFRRLNRRMHNKSFTADNQATIIGGRNVGDEYFDATQGMVFVDLDVLAVGPVVADVSAYFDRYWASASSYPIDRLVPAVSPSELAELASKARKIENSAAAAAYMKAVRSLSFVQELVDGTLPLEWAPTRALSDHPAKALGKAAPEDLLVHELTKLVGNPTTHAEVISAYFVPSRASVDTFTALARRGVQIRILTNALEATDVPLVHSGYFKRRKPLLKAGIALYELQRRAASGIRHVGSAGPAPSLRSGSQGGAPVPGASGSSLHAKTISVDGTRVFIGSFNFDPRSRNLNTELGFVIDSPALAQPIADAFRTRIPEDAYELKLADNGELYWLERRADGQVLRHDEEPGTTRTQRAFVWLASLLPIDGLL